MEFPLYLYFPLIFRLLVRVTTGGRAVVDMRTSRAPSVVTLWVVTSGATSAPTLTLLVVPRSLIEKVSPTAVTQSNKRARPAPTLLSVLAPVIVIVTAGVVMVVVVPAGPRAVMGRRVMVMESPWGIPPRCRGLHAGKSPAAERRDSPETVPLVVRPRAQ